STADTVVLTNYAAPTASAAGADQAKCNNGNFTMAANAASVGAGTWTVVSGTATITSASSESTTITGVPAGTSATLRWTIVNGTCSTSDDVVLTNNSLPSSPGIDPYDASVGNQTACYTGDSITANVDAPASGYSIVWRSTNNPNGTVVSSPAYSGTNNGGSVTYYSFTQNNSTGCLSASGTAVTLTIVATPPSPVSTGDQSACFCAGAILTAAVTSNPLYVLNWYYNNDPVTDPSLSNVGSITYDATYSSASSPCESTPTHITLTFYEAPATANAGADQQNCNTSSFTMSANPASVGTGTWSVIGGSATITNANSPTTTVTVAAGVTATLRWNIVNQLCSTADTVVLTNYAAPTASAAGADQAKCNNGNFTMAANAASVGAGTWTV
ncbi:MAG: hypothetical protein ACKOQ6_13120, partial [Bacteroidota bacterium]